MKVTNERYHHKLAYVHVRKYPSHEANALQAIKMASAFADIADTTFFIPYHTTSLAKLKQYYEVAKSPLRIRSMLLNYLPDRVILKFNNFFEKSVSFYLNYHPEWTRFHGQRILFVRDPRELLFWGFQKKQNERFRDWTFIFEAHSAISLRPNPSQEGPPFIAKDAAERQYLEMAFQALHGFDIVICLTQALADDIMRWTNQAVRPHVVRHASPLPHRTDAPSVRFGKKIIVGYIGQISQFKGINTLLEALNILPQKYSLRLIGRFKQEQGIDPYWLNKFLNDPLLSHRIEFLEPVPIKDVQHEIDRCDIVVQPASSDILNSKYEAPLKSFDYMARGKPIVAADVPCHRELYRNGENAILYHLNPESLAYCISNLGSNPEQAERIARGAWKQSMNYCYTRRAETILSLVKDFFASRQTVSE